MILDNNDNDIEVPSLDETTIQGALNRAKKNKNIKLNINSNKNKYVDEKTADEKVNEKNDDMRDKVFTVKEQLIYDILRKETERDEPRKDIKEKVIILLGLQLLFLALIVIGVLISKGMFGSFSDTVFLEILEFLKFLIASIIVEFIAMIFFIVRYLYDNKLIDVLEKWFEKL